MNKKIKLIIVSLILLVILGINISYAMSFIPNISSNNNSFFEVNEKELSPGKTLEMTIDLSKISYKSLEFVLNLSNVEIGKIKTSVDNMDIKLDEESNEIVFNITDIEKLNSNKIVLYYQIPESIALGTILQLNAQAINSEVEDDKVENQVEITIVEKSSDNKENQEGNEDREQQGKYLSEIASTNQNDMQNNMQDMNSSSSMQSMSNSASNAITSVTQEETATYNGSNNNYLASLEIDGVELTSDFNKEKSTYFATVEGLETITVTANAEDSSSKVVITGTDLKSGENKVLISVTAENGEVRYYRIFINNN